MIFTNYAAQKNKAREPGCSILRLMPVGCYSGRMCLEGQPNVALSIIWKPDNILLRHVSIYKEASFCFPVFQFQIIPNTDTPKRRLVST